jgi:hypothetical protein
MLKPCLCIAGGLIGIVVGIKLEHDPKYLQLRNKFHAPQGTDDLIGFNPNCIH